MDNLKDGDEIVCFTKSYKIGNIDESINYKKYTIGKKYTIFQNILGMLLIEDDSGFPCYVDNRFAKKYFCTVSEYRDKLLNQIGI